MIVIKSVKDVDRITNKEHAHYIRQYVEDLLYRENDDYPYESEADGWVVYFEKGDDLFHDNEEAWMSEKSGGVYHRYFEEGNGWEGVSWEDGLFNVVVLRDNQFGITYFVPDEPWVDADLLVELDKAL